MEKKRILFIHHSTGGNLLHEGNVRKLLYEKNPNVELWDHGYNLYTIPFLSRIFGKYTFRTGLSDKDGFMLEKDFNIVISNNSPKEYAEIFSRNKTDRTLSSILEFDIIIFKNCFPTSKIISDQKLEEHKTYYQQIKDKLTTFSDKKFIIFTPPPLRKELTTKDQADRARNLANWIQTLKETNITIFDFFNLLADADGENKNMLKREYCRFIPLDGHPNKKANQIIGSLFVNTIFTVIDKTL